MTRTTKIILGVAAVAGALYYFKRRADATTISAGPGTAAAGNSTAGIIGSVGDGVAKILAVFKPGASAP